MAERFSARSWQEQLGLQSRPTLRDNFVMTWRCTNNIKLNFLILYSFFFLLLLAVLYPI